MGLLNSPQSYYSRMNPSIGFLAAMKHLPEYSLRVLNGVAEDGVAC